MVIYVDVLLFVNTIVNYAILMTTEKLLKKDVRLYRLLLGSFSGAILSLLMFLQSDRGFYLFLLKITAALLLTLIAFGWKSKREYLKTTICNLIVAVIYSGLFILFYQLFRPPNMVIVNDVPYLQVNPLWLTALTGIIYVIVLLLYKLFSERIKSTIASLSFTVHRKDYACIGKIDTGCNLREPFSSSPVIIIDNSIINTEQENQIRVIPYTTVNGSSYLKAVKADRVLINKKTIGTDVYIASAALHNPHYQAIINSTIVR